MYNPFTEVLDESTDFDLIEQARNGSREALEKLVLRYQASIYNIAIRMVFNAQDAEEVTQEVLIKVITRLCTFQGQSQFRTSLYRITAKHILNMRRRGAERETYTFSSYASTINDTPGLDLPDPKSVPVEVPLLVEEAKISCKMGMLLCLDRQQRLIFTLGEILGVTDKVGGDILEISADNFRQSLSRARRDLYRFMHGQCGLVNPDNSCRCARKTRGFVEAGHVDPNHLQFVPRHVRRISAASEGLVSTIEKAVDEHDQTIFREHPFLEPRHQLDWLRRLLDKGDFGTALDLKKIILELPVTVRFLSCLWGPGGQFMSKLQSKVALVTGASKGIGAGIARELAAAGAAVVVNYASDRIGAESVVAEITAAGGQAMAMQGDVAKAADVAALFERTKAAFGSLDMLVNSVCVYQAMPVAELTVAEFHREININLFGPLPVIRESLAHVGPEGGRIIVSCDAKTRLVF